MQTQATTVGLYWRHMVVRCKLPQHDTSRYSKHDNTSRGNKKKEKQNGYLFVAMKYDVWAISLLEDANK